MTPEQRTRRRESGRKRAAMIAANFKRRNPGSVPFARVTIWPKKKTVA